MLPRFDWSTPYLFFFNDTATTEIYTLSLHDALPISAFVFYLVAYTLMTLAAFALLAAKGTDGERDVSIDDLAGLAQRRPWLAFALAVCMLSLLGIPGTAGFIGKWYILVAATATGQGLLAAVPLAASRISA